MARHSYLLILGALLRAACAFELNLVAEVVGGAAAASWFAAINRLKAGKGGVAAAGARLTLQAKKRPP